MNGINETAYHLNTDSQGNVYAYVNSQNIYKCLKDSNTFSKYLTVPNTIYSLNIDKADNMYITIWDGIYRCLKDDKILF